MGTSGVQWGIPVLLPIFFGTFLFGVPVFLFDLCPACRFSLLVLRARTYTTCSERSATRFLIFWFAEVGCDEFCDGVCGSFVHVGHAGFDVGGFVLWEFCEVFFGYFVDGVEVAVDEFVYEGGAEFVGGPGFPFVVEGDGGGVLAGCDLDFGE